MSLNWRLNAIYDRILFLAQILIGAVIAMGSADRDGRLHPGDELVYVDGIPVAGKTHRYVIDLMHNAARNGQVNLTVRRKVLPTGEWSLGKVKGKTDPNAGSTNQCCLK